MGTGTDIAMNSARVVLVQGDLRGIAKARALSVRTMRNIREDCSSLLSTTLSVCQLRPAFSIRGSDCC